MDRVSKAERELVRKMQRKTNADKIRSMTDEEMAELMYEITNPVCPPKHGYKYCRDGKCRACWLDWLRQEAEQ